MDRFKRAIHVTNKCCALNCSSGNKERKIYIYTSVLYLMKLRIGWRRFYLTLIVHFHPIVKIRLRLRGQERSISGILKQSAEIVPELFRNSVSGQRQEQAISSGLYKLLKISTNVQQTLTFLTSKNFHKCNYRRRSFESTSTQPPRKEKTNYLKLCKSFVRVRYKLSVK